MKLTGEGAYKAGAEDFALASAAAAPIKGPAAAKVFQDTLLLLWQGRIDRGELVPD